MRQNGIKASKDSGHGTAGSGVGEAPTATIGIKAGRDTGTRIEKDGTGSAMTATTIGRDPTAGSGPGSGTTTADRRLFPVDLFYCHSHIVIHSERKNPGSF